MSDFLLAVLRNCGVAIAISVFFAAARAPSHSGGAGVAHALGLVEASYAGSTAPTLKEAGCDQPAGRVCSVVDAGQRRSGLTP
jgi:hypothetical protein